MSYRANYDAIDWSQPLPEKYTKRPEIMPRSGRSPHVMPDTPGYYSVVSDKWIDGRVERREDLKRTNSVDWGDAPRLNDGFAKSEKFARKHGLAWEGNR